MCIRGDGFDDFPMSSADRAFERLLIAIERNEVETVRKMLDNGVDVNSANSEMQTPLFYAVILKHIAIMRIILERGHLPHKNYSRAQRYFHESPNSLSALKLHD